MPGSLDPVRKRNRFSGIHRNENLEISIAVMFEEFSGHPMPCNYRKETPLGHEHVIELLGYKLNEPFYICLLCCNQFEKRNLLNHIAKDKHRLKYIVSLVGICRSLILNIVSSDLNFWSSSLRPKYE